MQAITAIVRPEKVLDVQEGLNEAGFYALSKWMISGRGKQKGIQVGDVVYEEMTKSMLYLVVPDDDKDEVVDIVMQHAMTGESGNPGDGRVFVSPVAEAYTISGQKKD